MDTYVLHELSSCAVASVTFDLWWLEVDLTFLLWSWTSLTMHRFLNMLLLIFLSTQHYRCCFSRNCKVLNCQIQIHREKYHICERWRFQLKHISSFPFYYYFLWTTLQLETPFARICFGHAMSKAYQYATNDVKLCVGMKEVSLKNA
jgi:hypothetical protein